MKKEKDVYWNYFCLEINWKDFVPIYLVFLRAINNIEKCFANVSIFEKLCFLVASAYRNENMKVSSLVWVQLA